MPKGRRTSTCTGQPRVCIFTKAAGRPLLAECAGNQNSKRAQIRWPPGGGGTPEEIAVPSRPAAHGPWKMECVPPQAGLDAEGFPGARSGNANVLPNNAKTWWGFTPSTSNARNAIVSLA
jgi:hypothetical protein